MADTRAICEVCGATLAYVTVPCPDKRRDCLVHHRQIMCPDRKNHPQRVELAVDVLAEIVSKEGRRG